MTSPSFWFEGASGNVTYGSNGDRVADDVQFALSNFVASGASGSWVKVGVVGDVVTLTGTIKWSGDSTVPPPDGVTCPSRHVYDRQLVKCVPRIGLLMTTSNADGTIPASLSRQQRTAAMLMAVHHANQRVGTILPAFTELAPRHKVVPVAVNTQSSSVVTVTRAMRLFAQPPGVVSFAGPLGSSITRAVSSVTTALEVPITSATSTSSSLNDKSKFRYTTRAVIPDSITAVAVAEAMREFGWRRVGVLALSDEYVPSAGLSWRVTYPFPWLIHVLVACVCPHDAPPDDHIQLVRSARLAVRCPTHNNQHHLDSQPHLPFLLRLVSLAALRF